MRLLLPHIACVATLLIGAAATDAKAGNSKSLAPHAEKETNADRFRLGLGPLPPTRRGSDHSTSVPCESEDFYRQKTIGYLSTRVNPERAYTVGGRRHALGCSCPADQPCAQANNLIIANPEDSRYPFLGAVENGRGNIGPVAIFAGVASCSTKRRYPILHCRTSLTLAGPGHRDPDMGRWTARRARSPPQWTNSDGSHPRSTIIFFDRDRDVLGLTGDLGRLKAVEGSDRIYPVWN
ncbi:hypothetical protein C8R47DRAFT_1084693 [Mycena vitilis]|nr:hypothetical protein C8R47DRAFT_1084693 [Mycena vitilis]